MGRDPYAELVWQLGRLPGGMAAAVPDFFGSLLSRPPETTVEGERWSLREGASLELQGRQLRTRLGDASDALATLPQALLDTAAQAGISPLLLGLLALASGDVEGDRALKRHLPRVDAAARDLMLMTVCRLCG
ncbi:MAG TPA: hypothetical protein PKH69_10110 [Thiobacillaceae bacterium]|nr:hypothetical protein [Thiobacillaceae bacterium]HNU64830.1 hypothetical protein [Thiobacillaceae bacterium]